MTSATYHPSSNGLAERSVQTFNNGMKKGMGNDLQRQLSNFLFHYRMTPHTTTRVSPAELMMGRQLRTRPDLMRPDVGARVVRKQKKQKEYRDVSCKEKVSLRELQSLFVILLVANDGCLALLHNIMGNPCWTNSWRMAGSFAVTWITLKKVRSRSQ